MIFKMYRLKNSRRDKRDDAKQNITEQEKNSKRNRICNPYTGDSFLLIYNPPIYMPLLWWYMRMKETFLNYQ